MSLTVVLAVGLDSSTAGHSQNDLAVSGPIVATAESIGEVFHLFLSGDFDLVVLGHTITEKDRDGLTCMIRAPAEDF
jgi:hypothetical protein